MEDDSERDQKNRELCDVVLGLLESEECKTETYVTHAFFTRTIREQRLTGVSLEHAMTRGLSVYPVWMIQSRKSVAFLLDSLSEIDNVRKLIHRVRKYSPRLEACAFFTQQDFVRFEQLVSRATNLQQLGPQIRASLDQPNIHGWIYPDRAFSIIRFSRKPIGVTSQEMSAPPGRTEVGS